MVCEDRPAFTNEGIQGGEPFLMYLRFLGLLICMSCTLSWCNWKKIKRAPLFFWDWISMAVWMIMQYQYSLMIQGCLYNENNIWFIFICKFTENFLSQCIAFSTLLLNIQLYRIVLQFRTLKKIVKIPSSKAIIVMTTVAMLISITSAVFWNNWFVTGSYLWVASDMSKPIDDWTNVSFNLGPAIAGIIQVGILVIAATTGLFPDLRQCLAKERSLILWCLLIISGMASNFMSTFHFIATLCQWGNSKSWFFWSNSIRYMYIIFDSLVIMRHLHRSSNGTSIPNTAANRAKSRKGSSSSSCLNASNTNTAKEKSKRKYNKTSIAVAAIPPPIDESSSLPLPDALGVCGPQRDTAVTDSTLVKVGPRKQNNQMQELNHDVEGEEEVR